MNFIKKLAIPFITTHDKSQTSHTQKNIPSSSHPYERKAQRAPKIHKKENTALLHVKRKHHPVHQDLKLSSLTLQDLQQICFGTPLRASITITNFLSFYMFLQIVWKFFKDWKESKVYKEEMPSSNPYFMNNAYQLQASPSPSCQCHHNSPNPNYQSDYQKSHYPGDFVNPSTSGIFNRLCRIILCIWSWVTFKTTSFYPLLLYIVSLATLL